jgi:hypothetical protein
MAVIGFKHSCNDGPAALPLGSVSGAPPPPTPYLRVKLPRARHLAALAHGLGTRSHCPLRRRPYLQWRSPLCPLGWRHPGQRVR